MEDNKPYLPLAVTASSGTGGVSPPVRMMEQAIAGQTQALEQAIAQFNLTKAATAGTLITGLEGMARTIDWVRHDASSSAQTIQTVLCEALRSNAEEALRFMHELAGARAPSEFFAVQAAYFNKQTYLFVLQARDLQEAFSKLLPCFA
jgi:hypothetical protein